MSESNRATLAGPQQRIRGRFAPSPTGPLHFGSLVAALASYLDVRHLGGEWLLRIEDLDPPREVPGASADIMRTLEALGLHWDGSVRFQSREHERYEAALAQLIAADAVYPCACTRREIADSALRGIDGPVYPGTCRGGLPPGRRPRAWRVRALDAPIEFEDAVQGAVRQNVARVVGDFVVKRADGSFAYQLAVVLDDADQQVTHVVRGADPLDWPPRQIMLQRLLALPTPAYAHIPVAVNAAGEKLSKQTLAPALDPQRSQAAMLAGLRFLGQSPPDDLIGAGARELLAWASSHWNPALIPRARVLTAPALAV